MVLKNWILFFVCILTGLFLLLAGLANASGPGGNYLLKSGGQMSGSLTMGNGIVLRGLTSGGASREMLQFSGVSSLILGSVSSPTYIRGSGTPTQIFANDGTSNFKIWHEANDGAGSTLDADLWRGKGYDDYSGVLDPPNLASGAQWKGTITGNGRNKFCVAANDSAFTNIADVTIHVSNYSNTSLYLHFENRGGISTDIESQTFYVRCYAR